MRLLACSLVFTFAVCLAAEKKLPVAKAGNSKLQITATLYHEKDSIKDELGSDLGGYFKVIRVELTPTGDTPLRVDRDDFLLRSFKDGQKSGAFEPSQIAGRGALVVSTTSSGGGIVAEDRGPIWGGIPGTGGRPRRIGGVEPPAVGNSAGQTEAVATAKTGAGEKENPLLAVLKEKVLPEKEISEPLSGLLYFSLEGKHKPKDLELHYLGPAGKIVLKFR